MSEVLDYVPGGSFRAVSEKQTAPVVDAEEIDLAPPEFTPDPEVVTLVHHLFLAERDRPLRTVVFTGVEHSAGCSRIAASTASLLRSGDNTVCLVEANFASPSLADFFQIPRGPGMKEALETNLPLANYTQSIGKAPNLSLLPAGISSSRDGERLDRARLRSRLVELQATFDYVIIDAAPAHYDETLSFARLADGVVLVLEADQTRRTKAVAVTNTMRALKIDILGAVLNKRTFPIPEKLYRHL